MFKKIKLIGTLLGFVEKVQQALLGNKDKVDKVKKLIEDAKELLPEIKEYVEKIKAFLDSLKK